MVVLHRRTGIVSVATLSGLALAVGLTHVIAPEWSRSTGLDVWNYTDMESQYRDDKDRLQDELKVEETLSCQIRLSDHITTELIEGRLSLSEAVDEIEYINRERVGFEESLRVTFRPSTHRERLALYTLTKARRMLDHDPSAQVVVMARLEAEYQAMTGRPAQDL
jgi:hypothetical protein